MLVLLLLLLQIRVALLVVAVDATACMLLRLLLSPQRTAATQRMLQLLAVVQQIRTRTTMQHWKGGRPACTAFATAHVCCCCCRCVCWLCHARPVRVWAVLQQHG
jgi:hypothetical protein